MTWTKSEPRLILERSCPCALDWCPGESRTILDPNLVIWDDPRYEDVYGMTVADVLNALLSAVDR